jgi:predicted HicB family RNase H-like nuclease
MFEVKKTEYINKTFRMPTELVRKLEILAQEKNVSLNNLIVQCCEYALENTKDSEKNKK